MVNRVTGRIRQGRTPETFPHGVVFLPEEKTAVVNSLVSLCSEFPWEHLVSFSSGAAGIATATRRRPTAVLAPPPVRKTPTPQPPITAPAPEPARKPTPPISRPGCTAADNTGVVLYHLEGLSKEGKPNFGVLRVSKERLDEAATAAASLGRQDLAQQMRQIANKLPQVHDAEGAGRLAAELRPVAFAAWDLGAACKGSLTPEQMGKARDLARQVKAGTLTMEEAVSQVKGS